MARRHRPSAVATAKLNEVRERLVETVEVIDRLTARPDSGNGAANQAGR
jgi:hypothetical protein